MHATHGGLWVDCRGQHLLLAPERAIYWHERRAWLVADVHLGKVAHFRKAGMAVPAAAADENYVRLDQLLRRHPATTLYFLGDLFHSEANADWQRFEAWRATHLAVAMTLVRGNHDVLSDAHYARAGLEVVAEPLACAPFVLYHIPPPNAGADAQDHGYALAGHVHPAVRLRGGGSSVRLPCYWFGAQTALLPAFGVFTGAATVQPRRHDRVFVVADETVVAVGG